MPRKFIDVYDLQDHTNEMTTEIVPKIVEKVGGTGGSGTATNIADWAEKDSTVAIPIDKELALPEGIPASEFEGDEHANDTSVSLGSLFEQVYSLTGAMDYVLQATGKLQRATGNPTQAIDYRGVVEETNWASYAEKYPSLFSIDTSDTSSGESTVVGIHTTIEKITDTLVNLMSSSGSSSGSSLPWITTNGSSEPLNGKNSGFVSTQSYSAFGTVNTFTLSGGYTSKCAAYESDSTLAGAFLDDIFSGAVPSYTSSSFGTADTTVASTDVFYVFKVSINSVDSSGIYDCTVYYFDVTSTTSEDKTVTYTPVVKCIEHVKSKTTVPGIRG